MPRSKPRVHLTLACPRCGEVGRAYDLGENHLRESLGSAWPAHRRAEHPAWTASATGLITARMAACGTVLANVSTSHTSYDGDIRKLRDIHVDGCKLCQPPQTSFFDPPLTP